MSKKRDNALFCGKERHKDKIDYNNLNFNKDKDSFSFSNLNTTDIFTIPISNNDPLWRIRAYIMGIFYSDGTIKAQRSYVASVSQHIQDFDILENVQNAIGGRISGPYDANIFYLNVYGKELVLKLKEFGMKERHTYIDVANTILPPYFINKKINGQTLLRDFVRAYFDGDGTFSGRYKERTTRFGFPGPELFLNTIDNLMKKEITDISTFITRESIRYFITREKKYVLYSNFRIYRKGYGFYSLTPLDLKQGEIITTKHPWLKRLQISGSLNCIKFFNWLYENNDDFDSYNVNGLYLCGKRKFRKCLNILGNYLYRKERLAPNWNDVLPEVISQVPLDYYKLKRLMQITNNYLYDILNSLNLNQIFEKNKIEDEDIFRLRLKYLEYQDDLLGSFQKRIGSSNVNFYYSQINRPLKIPEEYKRKIELINVILNFLKQPNSIQIGKLLLKAL